jgi:hypothetical protein
MPGDGIGPAHAVDIAGGHETCQNAWYGVTIISKVDVVWGQTQSTDEEIGEEHE